MTPRFENEDAIVPTLLSFWPNMQAVYLFGSFAKGSAVSGSDVDIAVLFPHSFSLTVSPIERQEARFLLEKLLRREVDLVVLREAPPLLQTQAILGECLFRADEFEVSSYESLAMAKYQKWWAETNPYREAILSQARQRAR